MSAVRMNSALSRLALSGLAGGAVFFASTAFAAPIITQSFQTGLSDGTIQYGPDQSATYGTNPGGPAAVVPTITFSGFSGLITNGTVVFVNAPDGNAAAFLQAYQGSGGQIDWALSGLTRGTQYRFSFSAAGAQVVPAAPVTVSGVGLTPATFTPGTAYTINNLLFVATGTSGVISLATPAGPSNVATALDAFSISAVVPEPATWTMMIGGFGIVGGAMRYRKRETTRLAAA